MTRPARRPGGVFIAGTDTGVGKTIVTAAVAAALNAQGLDTGVMKPLATGSPDQAGALSDTDWLTSVAGLGDPPDLIAPYRFRTAAAPLVAAARDGRTIEPARIIEAFQALAARHDCVVVEGIGGVLVPITPDLFVADLAKQLGLPVLVVARARLGSINHTLMTLECLRNRGVAIGGLIFNHPSPAAAGTDESDTVPTILRLSGTRSFGELPHCEGLPASWIRHRDQLVARLDVQGLLETFGVRGLA
ncbi:MAG: dethiobiotin synthase [Nitrospirae bacterium]|nr:MAG: dethiobiotin synthase [Nitrospirota bacterium]